MGPPSHTLSGFHLQPVLSQISKTVTFSAIYPTLLRAPVPKLGAISELLTVTLY